MPILHLKIIRVFSSFLCSFFFFFNDTATTEIYTLSLHDALPICSLVTTLPLPTLEPANVGCAGVSAHGTDVRDVGHLADRGMPAARCGGSSSRAWPVGA